MFGSRGSLPPPEPHLANARDLADAAPGIVRGVYIRSDAPQAGDEAPEGVAWPPATVFDLRDDAEIRSAHPLAETADVRRVRILAEASVNSLMAGAETSLVELYSQMIDDEGPNGLAEVVHGIATAPAPVLAHCSAGKDRSGVVAALVLALLGAPREAIVADYTATKANMGPVMARVMRELPPQMRIAAQTGLVDFGPDAGDSEEPSTSTGGFLAGVRARVAAMLDAPPEAIESVLDAWAAHPGGVEGWYLAHGGDEETLATLRRRLLA